MHPTQCNATFFDTATTILLKKLVLITQYFTNQSNNLTFHGPLLDIDLTELISVPIYHCLYPTQRIKTTIPQHTVVGVLLDVLYFNIALTYVKRSRSGRQYNELLCALPL